MMSSDEVVYLLAKLTYLEHKERDRKTYTYFGKACA
jgi:hypothetical protein